MEAVNKIWNGSSLAGVSDVRARADNDFYATP